MEIMAIDLGGTTTKIALFENGQIKRRLTIKTNHKKLFETIYAALPWKLDNVARIGLAMPGFIDSRTKRVTLSGNLKLRDFDLRAAFKTVFAKEVYVLNDANAAALGEYWTGLKRRYHSLVFYTIGTGIGGGVIVNDQLVFGHHGYAGEFGHGGNLQRQYQCTCGLQHCLEALASATGIEKLLTAHYARKTTIADVATAFQKGDKAVQAIFRQALKPLATHISMMQTALNPQAIVLGGGPSALGEPLRALVEDLVRQQQLPFVLASSPIFLAQTKNDAGLYGAAAWALQEGKI